MKKLLLITVAALSLASCNAQQQATLEEIQAATVAACGFVPTAVAIASVIPQTAPFAVPASVIANAICGAVTAKVGMRRGGGPVTAVLTINGVSVRVTGHFQ